MTRMWIAGLGLLAAACSGATGGENDQSAAPVALVTLAGTQSGGIAPMVTVYGAAEAGPGGKVSLTAPVEAILVAVETPVGTRVAAGQVIARLAPSPTTRVELARAASDARAADAALARALRLRGDGLVGDADVETARAAARSADAAQSSVATQAGGLVVRAPAAGIVDSVVPVVGDLLAGGAPIASLSRGGDMRARFGIDQAAARTLRPGMPVRIAANAGRAAMTLTVDAVDPQTRLSAMFVRVPAASGIVPGETLTATVATGATDPRSVSVPYAALLDDAGQPYVFVVANGVAHRHDVTIGATAGDRVAITEGVKPGARVIVAGGTAVEDGMKVRTR